MKVNERIIASFIALLISAHVSAQRGANPSFEVVSVKVNAEGRGREHIQSSPTGLIIRNARLGFFIRWSYNVRREQIAGPSWVRGGDTYDIIAKAAAPSSEDQLRLMLQGVLSERFKVAFHRETKVLPIYEMTVAKGGPKLVESKLEENSNPSSSKSSFEFPHTSMSELAEHLENIGATDNLPVVDRTGIQGFFDISLKFPRGSRPSVHPEIYGSDSDGASVFNILEQQLGLKLELKKSPTEVLVIDHAERIPTEN